MSDKAEQRNAIMQAILNLDQRIRKLERARNGWGTWARQLIIALITALLAVLSYKEFVL